MQQTSKSVTQKFRRDLKSEDFVLICQENKQYKQLIKVMEEKQNILMSKVSELQKKILKSQNEKEEYQTICNQYTLKIHQYENIKRELIQEYRILKNQIDHNFQEIKEKDSEISQLQRSNENLQLNLVCLQQNAKTSYLIIEQLRQHISKLEKEIVDKKIAMFRHLIECKPRIQDCSGKKQNTMNKSNLKNNSKSFKTSTIYQNSKNNSNGNSISFSFASNESVAHRKQSSIKRHNKSIYI